MLICSALYFPPISFFIEWNQLGNLCLEQQETYQKRSFRNKCRISGPNGIVTISVPLLKGKHQQQPITEVKIAYHEHWIIEHFAALNNNYNNAPYFDHYKDSIQLLLNQKNEFLFDLNIKLIRWAASILSFEQDLSFTESFIKSYPENHTDRRNYYQTDPDSTSNKIQTQSYSQVWEDRFGFINNLSILDLIFCLGPEAGMYIRNHPRLIFE